MYGEWKALSFDRRQQENDKLETGDGLSFFSCITKSKIGSSPQKQECICIYDNESARIYFRFCFCNWKREWKATDSEYDWLGINYMHIQTVRSFFFFIVVVIVVRQTNSIK